VTAYQTLAIASLFEPHHAAIRLDREDNHEPDSDRSAQLTKATNTVDNAARH
jgi:hypothetical protein